MAAPRIQSIDNSLHQTVNATANQTKEQIYAQMEVAYKLAHQNKQTYDQDAKLALKTAIQKPNIYALKWLKLPPKLSLRKAIHLGLDHNALQDELNLAVAFEDRDENVQSLALSQRRECLAFLVAQGANITTNVLMLAAKAKNLIFLSKLATGPAVSNLTAHGKLMLVLEALLTGDFEFIKSTIELIVKHPVLHSLEEIFSHRIHQIFLTLINLNEANAVKIYQLFIKSFPACKLSASTLLRVTDDYESLFRLIKKFELKVHYSFLWSALEKPNNAALIEHLIGIKFVQRNDPYGDDFLNRSLAYPNLIRHLIQTCHFDITTKLIVKAYAINRAVFQYLLSRFDILAAQDESHQLITVAAEGNDYDCVLLLLKNGAKPKSISELIPSGIKKFLLAYNMILENKDEAHFPKYYESLLPCQRQDLLTLFQHSLEKTAFIQRAVGQLMLPANENLNPEGHVPYVPEGASSSAQIFQSMNLAGSQSSVPQAAEFVSSHFDAKNNLHLYQDMFAKTRILDLWPGDEGEKLRLATRAFLQKVMPPLEQASQENVAGASVHLTPRC